MLRSAVVSVVRSISGHENTQLQAAEAVHTAVGLAALSDIKADFVRKSRGETGEDGVKWARLSPKYLAYGRRFGTGEKAALKKAAGLGPGNRFRGLLTSAQDKRWRQIFARVVARLAASMGLGAAKARAGQIAWTVLKSDGAKTKLEVFGDRQHEILRDTGVLLNSLSPGQFEVSGQYIPVADQIFALTASGVIVGTNVDYSSVHQNGSTKKNIPARPFLPTDGAPQAWQERWTNVAALAVRNSLASVIGAMQ